MFTCQTTERVREPNNRWYRTQRLVPVGSMTTIGPGRAREMMVSETQKSESEVTQLSLTLCDPMDYSLPGFSIHGIFQARILEWVTISFSRRSS